MLVFEFPPRLVPIVNYHPTHAHESTRPPTPATTDFTFGFGYSPRAPDVHVIAIEFLVVILGFHYSATSFLSADSHP